MSCAWSSLHRPENSLRCGDQKPFDSSRLSPLTSVSTSNSQITSSHHLDMCKTVLYVWMCGHPATKRFRNSICDSAGVQECHVEDVTTVIGYPCSRCIKQRARMTWVGSGAENPALDDDWYVPSRCFIDVGFRSLNPFQDDKSRSSRPPISGRRHDDDLIPPEMVMMDQEPATPTSRKSPKEKIKGLCRRLVDRVTSCIDRCIERLPPGRSRVSN